MDPISVAMVRIMNGGIPRDILKQAFTARRYDPTADDRYFDNSLGTTIEEQIRLKVIEGRVAIDMNVVGGTEVTLPMRYAEREMVDAWNIIYRFDRRFTGGRRITSVLEMTYGMTQALGTGGSPGYDSRASQYMLNSRNLLRASTGVGTLSTSYVQLVGPNAVLVNDVNQVVGDSLLRARVSHEANFNDIAAPYWHDFGELVIRAVKSYIWSQLVIDIDENQIRGGATIGRIREIVDQYADAEQMYMEFLTTDWHKIRILSDPQQMRKIGKWILGGKPHR